MRSSTYFYNPVTCQYERARLKMKDVLWYSIGLLLVVAMMFVLLATGFDRLTESEREAKLRKENKAFDNHQAILVNQLSDIESTLNQLKQKDQELHQKLFEEASNQTDVISPSDKKAILLATESEFANKLDVLSQKSSSLKHQAVATNEYIFNAFNLTQKDLKLLSSIPTLQPIANPNLDLLVSGFGVRINPFHKGKYKHPGIDFAASRGTEVFASAQGKVIDINNSSLQAGYGNSIDIDHGHGFVTRYAHLETIAVKLGQNVSKKMVIGTVGNSGGSIGPHVHYEVIHKGENVDPIIYMIEGLDSHAYNRLVSLGKKQNQSLD